MRTPIRILATAAVLALAGCSQMNAAEPGPGPGARPGYGGGPGMMWGDGYGPGYGMGPGGYGMMGPGYGMGRGMMGPRGGGWNLPSGLSAEQRRQIATIQREARARQWPLMQQMHELTWGDEAGEAADEQAQRRDYERVAALHKQMFENMLETRKRIEAVLTPQQREELRRNWRPGP